MAAHSSVLAWSIPGMGEPGGLPSMGSYRVRHDWSDLAAAAAADTFPCWLWWQKFPCEDWHWSSNNLPTWYEEPTHWKRPWRWQRLRAGEEGRRRGWDGWMWLHWLNGHEFEQTPEDSKEQGSLMCCSPWGHKVSDKIEQLNNDNNLCQRDPHDKEIRGG